MSCAEMFVLCCVCACVCVCVLCCGGSLRVCSPKVPFYSCLLLKWSQISNRAATTKQGVYKMKEEMSIVMKGIDRCGNESCNGADVGYLSFPYLLEWSQIFNRATTTKQRSVMKKIFITAYSVTTHQLGILFRSLYPSTPTEACTSCAAS